MNQIDPTRCPICGEPNVCAMEKAKVTGSKPERCWCMDAVFTPAVMDQVPDAAKGKACVCANCVESIENKQIYLKLLGTCLTIGSGTVL